MDACAQAAVFMLMLALAGCATAPAQTPPRVAPFAGCLPAPPDLPPIATVEQLRADRDLYAKKLYPDCATRARRNAEAVK